MVKYKDSKDCYYVILSVYWSKNYLLRFPEVWSSLCNLCKAYSTTDLPLVHLHLCKINAAMFHSSAYHKQSRLVSSHLSINFAFGDKSGVPVKALIRIHWLVSKNGNSFRQFTS